jgi:hypothetical protein
VAQRKTAKIKPIWPALPRKLEDLRSLRNEIDNLLLELSLELKKVTGCHRWPWQHILSAEALLFVLYMKVRKF